MLRKTIGDLFRFLFRNRFDDGLTYRKTEIFRWINSPENLLVIVGRRFKYIVCCVVVH